MSHLGLAFVLMLRPFFLERVMSTDLLSFEHPSVLQFASKYIYKGGQWRPDLGLYFILGNVNRSNFMKLKELQSRFHRRNRWSRLMVFFKKQD